MEQQHYFKNSYEECRKKFLAAVNDNKSFESKSLESIAIYENQENDLHIDVARLKRTGNEQLIILSSGLHGIEGYVGNALQVFLLDEIKNGNIEIEGIDLLMIHAINPWGFKNNRRVTRNNVDLNRNFDTTEELFNFSNEGYGRLKKILEPSKKYSRWSFQYIGFLMKIFNCLIKYSKATLTQAIGQGQYEHCHGIIFGGKQFEKEKNKLEEIIKRVCKDYKKILVIDLHTGLGKRGKLQLLNAPKVSERTKDQVNQLFNNKVVSDNDADFFKENGSFLDFVWKINADKTCLPVMFEFGTSNSNKIVGAFRTLHNMVIENQAHQNGCKRNSDQKHVDKTFLEMFYPSDPKWRQSVIQQFEELFPLIFQKFKTFV